MTQDEKPTFLGRGWSFPPTFDKNKRQVTMVSNERDIEESLSILLSTGLGERVMRPDYGCRLGDYQFEALNTTLKTYLEGLVRDAILYYEPRIRLNGVTVDDSGQIEGRVDILVDYTVKTTNSRFNFVYPYYLEEANQNV